MLIDIENSFPYERYDYVFEDIHSKDLHEQISKRLKIQYLSDSSLTEVKEVNGTFFGPHYRIIVSLPVKINQKRKNVHFVVDTVSPRTYICKEVYESFSTIASFSRSVLLNNIATVALLPPSDSHFTDINVLGTEYLKVTSANLTIDFENEHVSLRFINHEDDQINPHFISQLKFNVLNGMVGIGLFALALFMIFKKKPLFLFSVIIAFLTFYYIVYTSNSN